MKKISVRKKSLSKTNSNSNSNFNSKNIGSIKIRKPDDLHVHFRDGDMLKLVAPHSARTCGRVLVMPNLNPPVLRLEEALLYRERILSALGIAGKRTQFGKGCYPLMSLYLSEKTTVAEVREVAATEEVIGYKLYPAHATTHSSEGVSSVKKIYPILSVMEKHGVHLMIHGEDPSVDIFDREKVFIDTVLAPLIKKFPALKITLEHITTKDAVDFILSAPPQVAASVTPHHLILNRNHLLSGGLNPHHYCMPIVKREEHRQYLLKKVLTGHKKFFLGTDTAPHTESTKLSACGCAGVYTAPIAIELCAEIFAEHNALKNLEKFVSLNGAKHYGLKPNEEYLTLIKKPLSVPTHYNVVRKGSNSSKGNQTGKKYPSEKLIPLRAGGEVGWRVK